MNYAIKILEIELEKLQKKYDKMDFYSTNSYIDFSVINNIKDIKKSISILNENNIKIIYE